MSQTARLSLQVNGERRDVEVAVRWSLADTLREALGLTGTHLGCEHGVCGACTVLVDGEPVRSCLMLGVQAEGRDVVTIEGVAGSAALHPVQEGFWEASSFQCGFCTPGVVMATLALLADHASPTHEQIVASLAGNLCRCTGYASIVEGVRRAAEKLEIAAPALAPEAVHDG